MDQITSFACTEIDKNSSKIYDLSHRIWELAEKGEGTATSYKLLVKFLSNHGFKVTKNFMGRPTSFLAECGTAKCGSDRRTRIVILCRYDAVKGKGHIQGHNLTMAAAVAAAIGIQDAINSPVGGKLGKVALLGVPDPRSCRLLTLLRAGAFKGYDLCLTAVPGPRADWNPKSLATTTVTAIYRDCSTDICGNDDSTANEKTLRCPMNAAVLAHTNVHLVKEHLAAPGWKVDGAITRGGVNPHEPVIETQTLLRIVAPSDNEIRLMQKRLLPCLEAAAEAAGGSMELSLGNRKYHSLISLPTLTDMLKTSAYSCGLLDTPLNRPHTIQPIDVASISHVMPTLRPMFYIGCDHEVGTSEFKNACGTLAAHGHAMAMARALTMTAVELMRTPQILQKAISELKTERDRLKQLQFEPFPTDQPRKYSLPKNVPIDCNKGWSKR